MDLNYCGRTSTNGGYRVLDLTSGTVAVTRSVVAQETDFTHMNSFAKEYDPLAPVTNPYVDQNPFELLQEKKDEDTDPDYEPEDEKYEEEPETAESEPETDESTIIDLPIIPQNRTKYGRVVKPLRVWHLTQETSYSVQYRWSIYTKCNVTLIKRWMLLDSTGGKK
jgi:hypothetical protein